LPLPANLEQARRLACALANNGGLQWLGLHTAGEDQVNSAVMIELMAQGVSHHRGLCDLRIHVSGPIPCGGAWDVAVATALTNHPTLTSAELSMPWSETGIAQLRTAIDSRTALSFLQLHGVSSDQLAVLLDPIAQQTPGPGGAIRRWERRRPAAGAAPMGLLLLRLNVTDVEAFTNLLVRTLARQDCRLQTLLLPDLAMDAEFVDALLLAVQKNKSLTRLALGKTPLTSNQSDAIDAAREINLERLKRLHYTKWV
jgi:hypothetical protein